MRVQLQPQHRDTKARRIFLKENSLQILSDRVDLAPVVLDDDGPHLIGNGPIDVEVGTAVFLAYADRRRAAIAAEQSRSHVHLLQCQKQ
jgi:hypothetical protein